MARRPLSVPTYRLHRSSGQAVATIRQADGTRASRYLGRFNSAESRAAYAKLVAELAAAPSPAAIAAKPRALLTLDAVLLAFDRWAEGHYRKPDGTPTGELANVRAAIRAVRDGYELSPAAEFGPLALKAVRVRMIEAGLSRGVINQRIGIVKRAFKWAASEELVPVATYQALATVAGLKRGRTSARELPPVRPVDDAAVDATLPFLNSHVSGLVELQRLTGCRPGEACSIRRCDIDMGGAVWLYTPTSHKTEHRGKGRVIALGPRAQELLREFFTPDLADYLFSPRRAVEEIHAARAARRVTPRWPSHERRNASKRKRRLQRLPAERYDRSAYGQAIDRACDRAWPLPAELAQRKDESRKAWRTRLTAEERAAVKAWRKEHRWAPNQLRHSFATRVRKAHGLEAAQVLLGHSKADVTQVYAERNEALAVAVAAKIG